MNALQRWLIVIAVWIFAVSIFLQTLNGRYLLPILDDAYAKMHPDARYDTWTGRLQVWENGRWEKGASSWVKELK